jgi:hypothetical protein
VEQVDGLCVGKDILAEKAIKKMAIGEVKPQEEDDEDCEIEEPASSPPAANPGVSREKSGDSGFPGNSRDNPENSGPTADDFQSSQENEELIQQEVSDPHPRVSLTHIQEFVKVFNEITPLTTFLEASV